MRAVGMAIAALGVLPVAVYELNYGEFVLADRRLSAAREPLRHGSVVLLPALRGIVAAEKDLAAVMAKNARSGRFVSFDREYRGTLFTVAPFCVPMETPSRCCTTA